MPVDQGAQPGIQGPPYPTRGWGGGHMAQALQLSQRPGTTSREVWLGPCRQATGGADEVCQAGLSCLHPALVHAIAITDQEPFPVVDQGREGFFGPMRMNHVERHRVT